MKRHYYLFLLLLPFSPIIAQENTLYYVTTLDKLQITQDGLSLPEPAPVPEKLQKLNSRIQNHLSDTRFPYAVGKDGANFYIAIENRFRFRPRTSLANFLSRMHISAQSQDTTPPSGTLYLPNEDWSKMVPYPFKFNTTPLRQKQAKVHHLQIKIFHYQRLQNLGGPGSAWFRHQLTNTRELFNAIPNRSDVSLNLNAGTTQRRRVRNDLNATYSLMSGGRAVSENLQLDRDLRLTTLRNRKEADLKRSINVSTIAGITIDEIDWENRIDHDKPVTPSPLAKAAPHDQYFLYFETFQQLVDLVDNSLEQGTPLLRLLENRSENAQTFERYQTQLALPLDDLVRHFGPELIKSVAITGSDPYLRTGTDLTVLFHAKDPDALHTTLKVRRKQIQLTSPHKPKAGKGRILNTPYDSLTTPNFSVRTYLARHKDILIVTNSKPQLQKILNLLKTTKAPESTEAEVPQSIASLQAYTWFRQRYDSSDRPFFLITDATIRQWCSPKWRIANSRRTQAAAILAELQSRKLDNTEEDRELDAPEWLGELTSTDTGPQSSIYGNLAFLTPISELYIDKVSPQEQRAYTNFRNAYQGRWRNFFDPIGGTLSILPNKVEADMSVLPLVAQSEYNDMRRVAGNVNFSPTAANPSSAPLLHAIIALDMQGATMRQIGSFASRTSPTLGTNALSWLGKHASFQLMDAPFWKELAEHVKTGEDPDNFLEKNIHRFPVLAKLDVKNPFLMTAFLGTCRAFLEQTSPGMLAWDNRTHEDQTYVRIGLSEKNRQAMRPDSPWRDIALYYCVEPKLLTFSLREDLLQQSIEEVPEEEVLEAHRWTGKSMGVQLNDKTIPTLQNLTGDSIQQALQFRSWNNLAILNEWRRNHNETDAVTYHQAHWHTHLSCPGGGTYQWNDKFQTYESTVFGCPARPKAPSKDISFFSNVQHLSFGLTFEDDGLRAKTTIWRK